jgi:hypothetical protein
MLNRLTLPLLAAVLCSVASHIPVAAETATASQQVRIVIRPSLSVSVTAPASPSQDLAVSGEAAGPPTDGGSTRLSLHCRRFACGNLELNVWAGLVEQLPDGLGLAVQLADGRPEAAPVLTPTAHHVALGELPTRLEGKMELLLALRGATASAPPQGRSLMLTVSE